MTQKDHTQRNYRLLQMTMASLENDNLLTLIPYHNILNLATDPNRFKAG
jgi:hypothetical protein